MKLKLAREIAARTKPRFIEIPRECGSNVRCTEKELNSIRGGLTAEEYRWKLSPLTMKRWTARPGGEGSLKQMDEWDS